RLASASLAAVLALTMLAGCETMDSDKNMLIPDSRLNISPSLSIPAEGVAAAGALYFIVDPLAPNWAVGEAKVGEGVCRIDLKMKRFTTGGDGEANRVFQRQAARIAQESGAPAYEIVEYSEGIESEFLGTRRVAQGVVRLR